MPTDEEITYLQQQRDQFFHERNAAYTFIRSALPSAFICSKCLRWHDGTSAMIIGDRYWCVECGNAEMLSRPPTPEQILQKMKEEGGSLYATEDAANRLQPEGEDT